ncbi:MAG: LysM peptidoglycan-binding domain-containing protein [Syntrophaceae bacterium]|nr:LysM peptidoglycan-binding domain-containing protein [Syntrophaceae bacterium]
MVHKILSVGMILLLSSACLPQVGLLPEKNHTDLSSMTGTAPSLFTESELEELFPSEASSFQTGISTSPVYGYSLSAAGLELPISDESNDEFSIEILPKNHLKKEPDFDIPIVINAKVEHFIQYFQTTAKKIFSNWLARSEKYIPFMKNLLKEKGLPEDLVYMALIESGFSPYAYSRRKASGPWQFIYLTGKRYGLNVNWWVDERRDPEKSTIAAAKYLKDLYDMFECWYLAAAGYNAGERKIVNAMKRYRTEDFWELSKYKYLKRETRDYVPQMIAAALIAKDPEKYGFIGIEYEEPLRYEKVKVPAVTDLQVIAKACEISLEELRDLNPELLRWCTPPEPPEYEIKIPFGKKEHFVKAFEALQSEQRFKFKTHVVKKGDTLSGIARLYRVNIEPMLEINRIKRTTRLSLGTNLLIPIPMVQDRKPITTAKEADSLKDLSSGYEEITYTIKKGDSLWSIANQMGVNIGALSRWNNLHPEKKLIPGDKLKIRVNRGQSSSKPPPGPTKEKEIIYVVKEGDTLWGIAQKYHVTIAEIRTWNRLQGTDRIYPADKLRLKVGGIRSSTLN